MSYNPDGTIKTTTVSGSTTSGLYAQDGSWNIVLNGSNTASPYGLYHSSGAMNAFQAPSGTSIYNAPNGNMNVVQGAYGLSPINPPGFGGIPSWVVNPGNPGDISFDFTQNLAYQPIGGVSTATSLLTITRASSGYVNDSNGNWTLVPANTARLSNLGLLVEEGRTNSLRNNSMQGAIVMANNVELLTNGNFAAGGNGWTANTSGGGSVAFATGSATIVGDGTTNNNYITQLVTGLTIGRSYTVIYQSSTNNAGLNILVGTSAGGGQTLAATATNPNGTNAATPDRVGFTATAVSHWVTVARFAASSAIVTGLSVQDGERAENGGFTANPINASINTVQNGWSWTNNAGTGSATYNSGAKTVTILGDGTLGISLNSAAIPTIVGQTYTLVVDVTSAGCNVQAGTSAGAANLLSVSSGTTTGQKFQFTATTTTSFVSFAKISAVNSVIANVSVQSAGSFPTNWVAPSLNVDGLIFNVVNLGVESGIDFVDIRTFGTSTATTQTRLVQFDTSAQVAAQYGQVWCGSMFLTLKAGSFANLASATHDITEIPVGSQHGVDITTTTNGVLGLSKINNTATLTNNTTTNAINRILLTPSGVGVAIDFTLRIGWPQFENAGSFLSVATASAVTAASGTGGVNGTAVYQVGGGTVTTSATTLNVTWTAGVMTVNSIATSGGYSPNAYPPSPAPLTYVSGTATGWTGATVTLTPGQLTSASVIAGSPIRTISVAVSRSADLLTRSATFGSAYTMWAQGTPLQPFGGSLQSIFSVSVDGANRSAMRRQSGTGNPSLSFTGGTGGSLNSSTVQNTGVDGKYAAALTANDQAFSFGGDIHTSTVAILPNTPTSMTWGPNGGTNSFYWNGFVEKSAIWLTQRVPNAQLQTITT